MPGRLTFLAFHPKALNDRSHLAGLLAFLLFREPSHPSADEQWYGVLSGKSLHAQVKAGSQLRG